MRILCVTAGAGGMYCGSCLRDNTLATELSARGHDVVLLPLYTPTLTDEPNVSEDRVFFGGVSVYLQQKMPLFRRTPPLLDKLWDTAPVLRMVSGLSVSTDPAKLGDLTVSMLRGEDGYQAKEMKKLLDWLAEQPPFDVVSLPNSLLIGLAGPIGRALRRPVCCTLQGEDLFLDGLPERNRSEAWDLIRRKAQDADLFLAVSDYFAAAMRDALGLRREQVRTVPLGITLEGHAPRPRPTGGPFTLGYFARVAPEKGLHRLCEAYVLLRRERGLPESRLEVAGYLAADHKQYFGQCRRRLEESGLAGEFHYRGALDRTGKIEFLQGLDVFSVPSLYREPKGMYVLEAMANGVPVVQPRHGAFPEILERTGGGVLVAPDDVGALADAILALVRDPGRRAELGRRGAEGVRRDYSAARMADRVLAAFSEVASPAGVPKAPAGALHDN